MIYLDAITSKTSTRLSPWFTFMLKPSGVSIWCCSSDLWNMPSELWHVKTLLSLGILDRTISLSAAQSYRRLWKLWGRIRQPLVEMWHKRMSKIFSDVFFLREAVVHSILWLFQKIWIGETDPFSRHVFKYFLICSYWLAFPAVKAYSLAIATIGCVSMCTMLSNYSPMQQYGTHNFMQRNFLMHRYSKRKQKLWCNDSFGDTPDWTWAR